MRHRTDANQEAIVAALKRIGCTVYVVGRPVDLLVGYRRVNYLLEVKTKTGSFTKFQREWIPGWRGTVHIVHDADEAIKVVTT